MAAKLTWLKEYDKDTWEYRGDDSSVRFVLGQVSGKNPLVCFGINPSKARPDLPDSTLIRVEKYAHINGFDGWVMLNIYPQRATNPNDLHKAIDTDIHSNNLVQIANILQQGNLRLWAAWGANINRHSYLMKCLREIAKISAVNSCKWVSLGKTKEGHPLHPLYRYEGFRLYETPLANFDMDKYLL
ncbi:MAG: DUF1643 domain-containing protein [Oscillospiraceae bacterium]|jgi:hypothetical protein|nr:DUF1643 domain-containing protein [Oscillospiraceae bacterium]